MIVITYRHPRDPSAEPLRLMIDAALSEEHTYDSEVTQFPVEDGSDITDNIRILPKTVKIEGVVSNWPIGRALSERAGTIALSQAGLIDPMTPAQEVLRGLLEIRDQRDTITITTSLGLYENMVMESLTVPRAADVGDALKFSATFRQVFIVTNKRVRVAVPRGKRKRKGGNKTASPFDDKPTYWCVEHKWVYVRYEDYAKASTTRSAGRNDVWTDYKTRPEPQYRARASVCIRKEEIFYDSKGGAHGGGAFVRKGSDGKPEELSQEEVDSMNSELERTTGVTQVNDPTYLKNGKRITVTDAYGRQRSVPTVQYVDENGKPLSDSQLKALDQKPVWDPRTGDWGTNAQGEQVRTRVDDNAEEFENFVHERAQEDAADKPESWLGSLSD